MPTYALTKNIIFNAEIEFEHGGIAFDSDDKLHGTAEVEQMFIDFKIIDQFNFRAPGIDLVPFGYINLYHEPTNFYSVHRPALTNGLIPTTWAPPATSIWGTLVEGLKYQFQISSALEDFGDDYGRRTDANTVPDGGYTGGFDGKGALGFGKPPRGDFRQLSSDMGYTLRVAYEPTFLPGFAGSTSIYYTANTTPRGAYAQLDNTMRLGRSSLAMFDTEFRYKIPKSKFELRGEYVEVRFGNPANLRANNDGDDSNNIGKKMYGYSGEIAYHVPLGVILASEWEAVPFYRYTHQ